MALLPHLTLLLALLHGVVSQQHPFITTGAGSSLSRGHLDPPHPPTADIYDEQGTTRKVAIIGAGPTGTSAAYFLSTASAHLSSLNSSHSSDKLSITIYERNRIGGRTAITHPYNDESQDPVELGASIFAEVNFNIRRAVRDFNLSAGAHTGLSGEMAIWDGQQFLFTGDQSSWWTSAKFFLRYGYSAITTQSIVSKQLAYFSALYRAPFLHARERHADGKESESSISGYPWSKVEDLAEAVNASALAATTAMQYFKDRRVSELFIEEMVEAATRVNYAQDTDRIHAFGALVSLAASGAEGVKDGNYRIFEEFARRSGARVLTGVEGEVTGLVRLAPTSDSQVSERKVQWYVGSKSGEGELYDAVIIATPWHNAEITLLNTVHRPRARPYVRLYVTLLTTSRANPRGEYFGMAAGDSVPRTILTSSESVRRAKSSKDSPPAEPAEEKGTSRSRSTKRGPKLDFFSLTYLRSVTRPSDESGKEAKEYVVKLFSPAPLSDQLLDSLFGDTISWLHRHEWDSYPYLTPTDRFPHFEVDQNLYYPNAMESLVSTMETSTVAAKNTVALLMQNWFGDAFVNGEACKWDMEDWGRDPMQSRDWAGWGCNSG